MNKIVEMGLFLERVRKLVPHYMAYKENLDLQTVLQCSITRICREHVYFLIRSVDANLVGYFQIIELPWSDLAYLDIIGSSGMKILNEIGNGVSDKIEVGKSECGVRIFKYSPKDLTTEDIRNILDLFNRKSREAQEKKTRDFLKEFSIYSNIYSKD